MWLTAAATGAALLGPAAIALAEDAAPKIDTGDTAWMLISSALVLSMTAPGLALFYGGLVRSKNVLSILMQSFILMAVISIQWILYGYSLAFAPQAEGFLGSIVGGLGWLGLNGVGADPNPDYAATIPHTLFMAYQMMFAIITPALITGAFAERMKFSAFLVFSILWATLVYDPLAHMVWGTGGLIRGWGALDFAGGTVVHISSGVSALVAAILIGKRLATEDNRDPHDVPMTVLGAGLLWFGWFGFNAGSALGATGQAANALLVTNTAAAAASITWVAANYFHKKKVSVVGAAAGAVAGLVAITPASGYVNATGALLIGLSVGAICYSATLLRERLKVDDALDVFAVHGVGGMFGAVATGIFAVAAIGGTAGAIEGNIKQVGIQLIAVLATVTFAAVGTFIIIKVVEAVMGLRVDASQEELGLDLSVHGETAYQA
jgi:Amt family ammonium transporter